MDAIMIDVTNVFNNLKCAVVKDNKVIDVILINNDEFDSLRNSFLEQYQANDLVVIDQNCDECCRVTIGGTYDGVRFYPEKRYESWVWNEEENDWISPVGHSPAITTGDLGPWKWNERLLQWEKVFPITEE